MIPLSCKEFPASSAELSAAITAALAEVFTLSSSTEAVSVVGELPTLQSLRITMDGAAVRDSKPPQKPSQVVSREHGFTVENFAASGRPISYQTAKLNLSISAKGLTFEFGRDAAGGPQLILVNAASGTADAQISDDDLQIALLAAATAGAKEYGVTVQDVHAVLVSDGPKSVSAEIRVKAKKLMMTGVITLRGRVDISDDLVAAVSNLGCTGDGIVGSTVAAIVQKKVQAFEGVHIPLQTSLLGELRLREVNVSVSETITISAEFGKNSSSAI